MNKCTNVAQLRIYVNAHKFQYNLLQIILRERLEEWFLWLNFRFRFNYTKTVYIFFVTTLFGLRIFYLTNKCV